MQDNTYSFALWHEPGLSPSNLCAIYNSCPVIVSSRGDSCDNESRTFGKNIRRSYKICLSLGVVCSFLIFALTASTASKTRIRFLPANFSKSSLVHVGSPSRLSYKRSNRSGYFETSSNPTGILVNFTKYISSAFIYWFIT